MFAADADDDGGNGVKLSSPANLHTFWDGVLGGGDASSTALNAIVALQDAPESAINDLTVSDWIKESFECCRAHCLQVAAHRRWSGAVHVDHELQDGSP